MFANANKPGTLSKNYILLCWHLTVQVMQKCESRSPPTGLFHRLTQLYLKNINPSFLLQFKVYFFKQLHDYFPLTE